MDDSRVREFDDVPVPRLKRPRTGHPTRSRESNVAAPRRDIYPKANGDRSVKLKNRIRNGIEDGRASLDHDSAGGEEQEEQEEQEEMDPTTNTDGLKMRMKREVENEDPSETQDDAVDQSRTGSGKHDLKDVKDEQETLDEAVDPPDDRNDVSEQEEEDSESSVEMSADGWARLENSGRGLTAMVEAAGVRGVRVEQWYNIPQSPTGGRVFALVVLYKWGIDRGDTMKWNPSHAFLHAGEESAGGGAGDIMLISQLINSGSATQAIVSALLNISESLDKGELFDLGDELRLLRTFMLPMPHFLRGTAVCSSKAVRSAHDAAAAKFRAPSVADIAPEVCPSEDLWMYSVFMPGGSGRWVYEMNGCADEPIVLGCVDPNPDDENPRNTWIDAALEPVMKRIEDCRTHRVRFQLFAVVDSAYADESVYSSDELWSDAVGTDHSNATISGQDHSALNGDLEGSGMENGNSMIASVVRRLKSQMKKNPELRKLVATHNYDVFFVEMMKLMASRGDLNRYIAQATATNGQADDNASASSTH